MNLGLGLGIGSRPPLRRNLLIWTQEFDNAAWLKSACAITADQAADPFGGNTADLLTSSGDASIRQGASCLPGVAYTGSVWLRTVSGSLTVNLYRNDNGTGFATNTASVTTSWQRFSLTATASATASQAFFQIGGGASVPNLSTLLIWGAQLEVGTAASPYQRIGASFP